MVKRFQRTEITSGVIFTDTYVDAPSSRMLSPNKYWMIVSGFNDNSKIGEQHVWLIPKTVTSSDNSILHDTTVAEIEALTNLVFPMHHH